MSDCCQCDGVIEEPWVFSCRKCKRVMCEHCWASNDELCDDCFHEIIEEAIEEERV